MDTNIQVAFDINLKHQYILEHIGFVDIHKHPLQEFDVILVDPARLANYIDSEAAIVVFDEQNLSTNEQVIITETYPFVKYFIPLRMRSDEINTILARAADERNSVREQADTDTNVLMVGNEELPEMQEKQPDGPTIDADGYIDPREAYLSQFTPFFQEHGVDNPDEDVATQTEAPHSSTEIDMSPTQWPANAKAENIDMRSSEMPDQRVVAQEETGNVSMTERPESAMQDDVAGVSNVPVAQPVEVDSVSSVETPAKPDLPLPEPEYKDEPKPTAHKKTVRRRSQPSVAFIAARPAENKPAVPAVPAVSVAEKTGPSHPFNAPSKKMVEDRETHLDKQQKHPGLQPQKPVEKEQKLTVTQPSPVAVSIELPVSEPTVLPVSPTENRKEKIPDVVLAEKPLEPTANPPDVEPVLLPDNAPPVEPVDAEVIAEVSAVNVSYPQAFSLPVSCGDAMLLDKMREKWRDQKINAIRKKHVARVLINDLSDNTTSAEDSNPIAMDDVLPTAAALVLRRAFIGAEKRMDMDIQQQTMQSLFALDQDLIGAIALPENMKALRIISVSGEKNFMVVLGYAFHEFYPELHVHIVGPRTMQLDKNFTVGPNAKDADFVLSASPGFTSIVAKRRTGNIAAVSCNNRQYVLHDYDTLADPEDVLSHNKSTLTSLIQHIVDYPTQYAVRAID